MPDGGDTGERQLLTITLGVAGVMVIGLGVFVYFGLSKLGGLKNESKRLNQEFDTQDAAIRDIRAIEDNNTRLKNRIEQYEKFVVKEEEHYLRHVDQRLEDVGDQQGHEEGFRSGPRKRRRSETGSSPPSLNGLQRTSRHEARTTPRTRPTSLIASTA